LTGLAAVSGGREPAVPGISPAGEAGALECPAAAFFLDLPLMKRAKKYPMD
jgi:hypothetical protein